jgi:hypothetical protein
LKQQQLFQKSFPITHKNQKVLAEAEELSEFQRTKIGRKTKSTKGKQL